jgi:TolA-binding protein
MAMTDKSELTGDEFLGEALTAADLLASHAPPTITAESLLAVARRRRARAVADRAVAAALVGALAIVAASRPSEKPQLAQSAARRTVDEIRAELARLEGEAAVHERVVQALAEAHALDALSRRETNLIREMEPAGTELVRQEAARTAAISWQYATIVEQDSADVNRAKREYERIRERFPNTHWSKLAAVSLERLSAAGRSSM